MSLKVIERQRGRAHWHEYVLDGTKVPGVTTVLNGGIPKPALKFWAARVGGEAVADLLFGDDDEPSALIVERLRGKRFVVVEAAAKAHEEAVREAQVKGTDVHALAEAVMHDAVELPPHLADHVEGYVAFLERAGVVVELTERACASRRHGYGGRFDLVAQMFGERWLLDLKTGSSIYPETACQTAAYARADFYVDGAGTEWPMPECTRIGALHVTEAGTELVDLGDVDEAFALFLNVKAVSAGLKTLDAIVKRPPVVVTSSLAGELF